MAVQYWSIYYANSKVLIPTSVKTTDGVRMIIDPMKVIDIKNHTELKHTILSSITKDNAIVPHPSREEMSKPALFFKKLGFKTHKSFINVASRWDIFLSDGIFEIQFWMPPDGTKYRSPDPSRTITFSVNTPVETVVDKLIEIIQETHREKIAETTAK